MIRIKLLLLLATAILVPELLNSQELEFRESEEGILLMENEYPRFFYQTATKSKDGEYPRANYIHPLYGPNGEVLTEDFPEDHLHHRGIFWSWHQLYVEGKRIADPWLTENIHWEVQNISTSINENTAEIKAEVFWIPTSTENAVIKENVSITYESLEDGIYTLTFDLKFTALVDGVAIGGSEDEKGYGGFSPRFALPENVSFHSTSGKIQPQNLPVQAGPWMELKGSFDPSEIGQLGIVIMGEPENLPSYQGWILRSSKSMQNMAFPGKEAIEIKKGKSLNFRNQILVHSGLSTDEIETYYKEFRNQ
ncbi:DUF6807 family protein [Salegentibacter sp. F188]|uniref:DUF6807 family protein n=1 Tax=Autumnicola patrickiae TaxID=3075591 RepID=A0ABU3DZT9_9FLAO|nr:DUF6807 family protein [Salegentibacter sp. F188]MDT0689259.1 DUF6807 family protein [Salegentibacter sp. F188]